MEAFTSFFLALLSTFVFIKFLLKLAKKYQLYDVPGGRKMHRKPVPRLGGVAMAAGASLPIFIWLDLDTTFKSILMGICALSCMGLVDDLVELKWSRKMMLQAAAAMIVVLYGNIRITNLGFWAGHEVLIPNFLSIPLTFLFILGVTNAINLTDGLDGLAGGLCTFIFGVLMLIAYERGLYQYMLPLAAILGSIWGFLRFNTHPAIIFMGDSGSYFLGFSAAVFGLLCTQTGHSAVSPAVLLLILAIPVTDTLSVMVERAASGTSIFMPDRRHLHFRLINAGLSHREAVAAIYILQAFFTFLSLKFLFYPAPIVTVIFIVSIIFIFGGLKFVEVKGWKIRKGVGKYQSRGVLGKWRLHNIVVNTARYFTSVSLSLYMIVPALLPNFDFDENGMFFLFMPIVLSLSYFFKGKWFPLLNRMGFYMVACYVTIAILRPEFLNKFSRYGMPSWYIFFLVTLAVATILYMRFVNSMQNRITPLDLLIFLVTLALTILPMHFDLAPTFLQQWMISMVVLVYAAEIALDQGTERRKLLFFAANAGALIIGLRGALALLKGL